MTDATGPVPDRPSPATAVPGAASRLVGCSPDRTLLVEPSEGGGLHLVKIYDRGSMEDAAAEAAIGRLAQVAGVVRYREVRRDPRSGRPSVVLDWNPGIDVEDRIGRYGPLAPTTAARIGARLATTLAALHAISCPEAPHGILHRDVKPSNVLLAGEEADRVAPERAEVLLLDFEHAVAVGGPTRAAGPFGGASFTGGTHGYAPPEAYAGAAPTPAFDVYGLGATLLAMVSGCPPLRPEREVGQPLAGVRRAVRGLPEPLAALIEACLATAPEERPAMHEVASALAGLVVPTSDDERQLDQALAALQREDLAEAAHLLRAVAPERSPRRHAELSRMLARGTKLIERAGATAPLGAPRGARQLAAAVSAAAPRVAAWRWRFPASPRALAQTERVREAFAELLVATPREVAAAKRSTAFADAESLLETALAAARAIARLPVRRRSAPDRDPRMLDPIERDPARWLMLAQKDVREAARTHAELLGKLHEAEARLDLREVERVLASAASLYSGASPVVASLKDRAHRLRFYVERISQPVRGLEELGEHLTTLEIADELEPLRALQAVCARCVAEQGPTGGIASPSGRGGNVRVLQQMLHDLVAEFPHVQPIAERALAVLDRAMVAVTERCWALLEDAKHKLRAEPIPVRPLQSIVHRVDALRLLAVLVDRPGRPRADLLDAHERLRLEVDQARAARDRLARGAEAAMERGHLTTALFDMKRAVDRFSDEPGEMDGGGHRLIAQLEKAQRKKNAIEQAAAKNMRLASRYADLQDDPKSRYQARLETLVERQRVLRFLVRCLPEERVGPYRNDLRNVAAAIADERAQYAEAVLDRTIDLDERERIARRMVQQLSGDSRDGEFGGRVLRILHHWQRHLQRARRQLRERDEARRAAQRRRQRRRRRRQSIAAALLVIGGAAALHYTGLIGGRDPAAALAAELEPRLATPFVPHANEGRPQFESVEACIALDQFVDRLEAVPSPGALPARSAVAASARRLVDLVHRAVEGGTELSWAAWADDFCAAARALEQAVQGLAAAAPAAESASALARHVRRFGARAQEAGFVIASLGASSTSDKRAMQSAIERLSADGHAALSPESAAAIRSLLQ